MVVPAITTLNFSMTEIDAWLPATEPLIVDSETAKSRGPTPSGHDNAPTTLGSRLGAHVAAVVVRTKFDACTVPTYEQPSSIDEIVLPVE